MSERYTFSGDRPLITINDNNSNNVEWNSFNSTLTNTINDGYVTVNEQTQYLSALDDTTTNQINLENLNLTPTTTTTTTNPKIEIANDSNEFLLQQQQQQQEITHNLDEQEQQQQKDELGENQVVVYTVEGSDELYGIQLAQDEDGNIQKYQFQFRKTEDGQLEAIPETIQILPLDEDEIGVENNDDLIGLNKQHEEQQEQEQQQQQRSLQIYVQNENPDEHILPDRMEELSTDNYNNTLLYTDGNRETNEDIKDVTIEHINIKQEVQDFINYNDDNSQNNERILDESTDNVVEQQQQQQDEYSATLVPETIYTLEAQDSQQQQQQQIPNETQENFHNNNDNTMKHLVLPEIANNLQNLDDNNVRNGQTNDSDNDEYQVVEGLHITGDVDDDVVDDGDEDDDEYDQQQLQHIQQQQKNQEKISTLAKTNILKHNQKHPEKIEIKKDNRYFLYFVHNEKENVDDSGYLNNNELYKTNPRSILKPCYLTSSQQTDLTTTTTTITTSSTTTTITTSEYDERLSKRFARNKEAIQARNLYNFINKTTIPLAPIRKDRLPRKQKIKPVERQDEQIVVQEVMVSSNNSFIESNQIDTTMMIKRDDNNYEITDYVELTDSDSDYNPNNNNNNQNNQNKKKLKKKKNKKRYKLRNHITISDSSSDDNDDDDDDDDDSVIELDDLSDDDDDHDDDENVVKKKRGRPPKIDNNNDVESPLKKLCLDDADDDDNNMKKTEIPCPKCTKSFPSQNSLKTHLQHHNLEENTINKNILTSSTTTTTKFQHKCVKCNELFKNRILLAQHKCPIIYTCTLCKKKFTNILDLSKHKRTHIKQQLCRNTSVIRVSPKKCKSKTQSPPLAPLPPPQPHKFKSPPKSMNNVKCKQCGKVCSSLSILNLHMKSHKLYNCCSCKLIFPSKLLLDNHIQKECGVKLVRNTSDYQKNKKSTTTTTTTSTPNFNNKKKATLTLICDECSMEFTNSKMLIKHKIDKHNLQTPDKSLLEKELTTKRLYKPKVRHCGLPAKQSLRKIYADMQIQLNQEQETKKD